MALVLSTRESKAIELKKRADAGDADAQYDFALYLLTEDDETPRKDISYTEVKWAMDYLSLAAAQGYRYGWAAAALGDLYDSGELIPQDYEKARLWYNTALLLENPGASRKLGEYAHNGINCEIDYEQAAWLYAQSLCECYVDAFINLGGMYMRGEYFPQDIEFAKSLFEFVHEYEKDRMDMFDIKSPLYEIALSALDELGQVSKARSNEREENELQKSVRKQLLDIMNEGGKHE